MPSQLEQEIASQPEGIARLLERETQHVKQIVKELPLFTYVVIAARGSSDHAATYAQYVWAALGGNPVALAAPSLHTLYHAPPRLDGALVVGISQSGQSPDILAVVQEGKRQGRPTLAITNDRTSPLAAAADFVVELHAGIERSVAATKTYTAQLAVIALFAAAWNGNSERLAEAQALPQAMEATLQLNMENIAQRAERYCYSNGCVVIGRGYNYATAFELALKLKELTSIMVSAYSSADFRHGPIATIHEGLPTLLVMPSGAAFNDMFALAGELREREAELLVISDAPQALHLAKTPMPIAPAVPEWLSPLVAVLPGQQLALHLALAKGLNPDLPRGLHKVTKTF
jgi:glutamine---fructose-6-phosphate transaminase (isomerizing)